MEIHDTECHDSGEQNKWVKNEIKSAKLALEFMPEFPAERRPPVKIQDS